MKAVGVASSSGSSLEKRKRTNLEKCGEEHCILSGAIRDKMKSTTLKNYGVEFYMQSDEFKKKREKNCIEKHGVQHHQQTKAWKDKISSIGIEKSSRMNLKLLKGMFREQGKKIPSGLHMKSDDFIDHLIEEMKNGSKPV